MNARITISSEDETAFPGVIAADLEGTLTEGYTWRGMRDYLMAHGQEKTYRRFFRRQLPGLILYRLKLYDDRRFKEQWIVDMIKCFAGYSVEAFDDMAQWVHENELWSQRRERVVAELRAYLAEGFRVIIVSGLFQPMLRPFVAAIGPQVEAIGTPIRFVDDRFSGKLDGPLNVGDLKVERLRQNIGDIQLQVAYGDTRRDIAMLEMSLSAVAVHPDEKLLSVALQRGWRILE